MKKTEENKQRKNLKEYGHTPSYIEWMIWNMKQQPQK